MCPSNHDAFVSFLLGDPKSQDEWPSGRKPLNFTGNKFLHLFPPTTADRNPIYPILNLETTDSQYAYLMAIGTVGSAAGAYIYKKFLREVSWHPLFVTAIVVSSALSATQLILIYGLNRE